MPTQTRKRKRSLKRLSPSAKKLKKSTKSPVTKTKLNKPDDIIINPNFEYTMPIPYTNNVVEKEEEDVDERGVVHSKIKQLVNMLSNISDYTTRNVISIISSLSSLTSRIPPISNFFSRLSGILSVSSWLGKIGFEALFSLHPNVIAPIVSLTISSALGYTLGSFVGGALWPSYEITDRLYSILSLGTNISYTGLTTAAVAVPIGGFKLTRSIGNFLDVFQLERPDDSTLSWLLKKMSWGMIGGFILMMHINGFNPASIVTLLSQLTTLLPSSPGPLSTLNMLFSLYSIKNMISAGDYKGALIRGVTQLFIHSIMGTVSSPGVQTLMINKVLVSRPNGDDAKLERIEQRAKEFQDIIKPQDQTHYTLDNMPPIEDTILPDPPIFGDTPDYSSLPGPGTSFGDKQDYSSLPVPGTSFDVNVSIPEQTVVNKPIQNLVGYYNLPYDDGVTIETVPYDDGVTIEPSVVESTEVKGIVASIFDKIANIELPDVFSWTNITEYLKSCVVSIQSILGSSVAGISTSWILGGMVCILAVYSVWKRITVKKKKLEDKQGAIRCVQKFVTTIDNAKDLIRQTIEKSNFVSIKQSQLKLNSIDLSGNTKCCQDVELGLSTLRTFVLENNQWDNEKIQKLMNIVRDVTREVVKVTIDIEGDEYSSLVQNTVETLRFDLEGALISATIVEDEKAQDNIKTDNNIAKNLSDANDNTLSWDLDMSTTTLQGVEK